MLTNKHALLGQSLPLPHHNYCNQIKPTMPPKKRTAGKAVAPASKRIKVGVAIKADPDFQGSSSSNANKTSTTARTVPTAATKASLKDRFIDLFSKPEHKAGISNPDLKEKFGASYVDLVPIINELTKESRLVMSRSSQNELFYNLVSADVATKFSGLDTSARMVYQVIERAGNMGIWTKEIRLQTNIQQQALNKIFKALEVSEMK